MEQKDPISRQCPRCGKRLPTDAPEGLCAACLFAAGAETLTSIPSDEIPTLTSAGAESAPGSDEQRLLAGQSWGPYRVGRLLGRGGMGEVYEAEHSETGRRVALKVLRSRLQNADDRARFLREGQLAASISHPHTVYIFGSEEIEGMPVISMELLGGGTLKDRVAAAGPIAPAEAVSAVLDIVGGLDAAQAAGILHRDIKPSNCFLDNEGSVKVGDFGLSISTLARDVHHDFETGGFQGTPQFASPEQLRGEPLDVRSDIYAVGATLYYLLTGQPPFDARDLRELVVRAAKEQPKSPRLLHRDIPQGLAAVVLRCLAKRPAERPASYAALAEALRPYAFGEDVPAGLGLRLISGAIDSFIITIPVSIWVLSSGNVLNRTQVDVEADVAWTFLVNVVYFVIFEGIWGVSPGKKVFGFRVVSTNGSAASLGRILVRTAIFYSPNLLLALLASVVVMRGEVRAVVGLVGVAALFFTVQRKNSWAGLHEIASGTRVVLRSLRRARVVVSPALTPVPAVLAKAANVHYGPFTVDSGGWDTGTGQLFRGFDPVLRRPVWIHAVPQNTPEVSAARRDIGRPGRLFWLTGRRSVDENWDAFEAPDGEAYLALKNSEAEWPTKKSWLMDLANELADSTQDGSTPVLSLDRLWIRSDGRLVLLDFRAPQIALAKTMASPVGLLSAVAGPLTSAGTGAVPVPLSARDLLRRWISETSVSLDEAQKALTRIVALPDQTPRWKRALPIASAIAPAVFMLIVTLAILPTLFDFLGRHGEMVALLEVVRDTDPPAGSPMSNPEVRTRVERYLAGKYGATLRDDGFWKSTIMQELIDRRQVAIDVLARHPSVSEEELSQISPQVAPILRRIRQGRGGQDSSLAMGTAMAGGLGAISLLVVTALSLLSSLVLPGGIVTRLLGLAVVTKNGAEISRWRSLARALVAWAPAIVWLAALGGSEKISGWLPAPTALPWGSGLAIGVMIAGAIYTLSRPSRGPHDRLVGTFVVPR